MIGILTKVFYLLVNLRDAVWINWYILYLPCYNSSWMGLKYWWVLCWRSRRGPGWLWRDIKKIQLNFGHIDLHSWYIETVFEAFK